MKTDKIALVTGSGQGIGRATAVALSAFSHVIVADIDKVSGEETVSIINKKGGSSRFVYLDVSDSDSITELFLNISSNENKLDYAVNNAGIGGEMKLIHELDLEDWDKILKINLTGVFLCMKHQIKLMLDNKFGRIVNVSSMAGTYGFSRGSSYSATKHAVIGLTKSAAIEYGSENIRVNSVCPGFVQTKILDDIPDYVLDFNKKYRVPMKRIGKPEEVAESICWLLSEKSSFTNGHSLYIDGGFSVG